MLLVKMVAAVAWLVLSVAVTVAFSAGLLLPEIVGMNEVDLLSRL